MQDNQTWHRVHGGTCQIVIIAYTQNIGIGELIIEERVRKCAVAVVSRPRLTITRTNKKVKSKKNM